MKKWENLPRVLNLLNEMEARNIIGKYAIGGSIGAMFYVEPFLTQDLDIFLIYKHFYGKLIDPSPIHRFLKKMGYEIQGWRAVIENIPVDFLPDETPLIQEAIEEAVEINYEGVNTRVMGIEYLMAIAVECGRPTDKVRLHKFLTQGEYQKAVLNKILKRYRLTERYHKIVEELK